MNILQIRSMFEDNGPGSQSLTIAEEFRRRGHQVYFTGSGGVMIDKIRATGFEFFENDNLARNARDPISVIRAMRALRRIFKAQEIDVVHAHNAAVALVAYFASLFVKRKIRIVHSVRGIELRKNFAWRNWIYRFYPAKMLAVCQFTKNELIKLGAKESDITVTYNGVNLMKFDITAHDGKAIREEFNIPEDAIVIGHVGSMSQKAKGQHVLIRAFKQFYERYPNVHVVLVGDGMYRAEFESIAEELEVTDRVHFAGQRFDIPDFQGAFNIFSLPSVHGEMFPNAILEAMAMGNPWVGSDISGLSEQTGNGKAGTVLPIGDVDALAKELESLVVDDEKRRTMGKNAVELVNQSFTITSVCDKIQAVYQS